MGLILQTASHVTATEYIQDSDNVGSFSYRLAKRSELCDLSNFKHGAAVGARHRGLSVTETDGLLGISHTVVSRVYREWCSKANSPSL